MSVLCSMVSTSSLVSSPTSLPYSSTNESILAKENPEEDMYSKDSFETHKSLKKTSSSSATNSTAPSSSIHPKKRYFVKQAQDEGDESISTTRSLMFSPSSPFSCMTSALTPPASESPPSCSSRSSLCLFSCNIMNPLASITTNSTSSLRSSASSLHHHQNTRSSYNPSLQPLIEVVTKRKRENDEEDGEVDKNEFKNRGTQKTPPNTPPDKEKSDQTPVLKSEDYHKDEDKKRTEQKDGDKKRNPLCARCRNHKVLIPVRGHKKECPFQKCKCELCDLTQVRQKVMACQVKVRRKEKKPDERLDSSQIIDTIANGSVKKWLQRKQQEAIPDDHVPVDPSTSVKGSVQKQTNARSNSEQVSHFHSHLSTSSSSSLMPDRLTPEFLEKYKRVCSESLNIMENFMPTGASHEIASDFLLRSAFFALAIEFGDVETIVSRVREVQSLMLQPFHPGILPISDFIPTAVPSLLHHNHNQNNVHVPLNFIHYFHPNQIRHHH